MSNSGYNSEYNNGYNSGDYNSRDKERSAHEGTNSAAIKAINLINIIKPIGFIKLKSARYIPALKWQAQPANSAVNWLLLARGFLSSALLAALLSLSLSSLASAQTPPANGKGASPNAGANVTPNLNANMGGAQANVPFKPSQVGGAPMAHSLEEYFKISEASRTEIERFCGNISARAGDTRSTLQIEKMLQLKADIEERIKALEAKRQEYELWLKKRDAFLDKTKDSLVAIVAKMKPSAAAEQLALVDDFTAASIILKLNPRVSSLIMNELPPQKNAGLTKILISAQKINDQKANDNSKNNRQKSDNDSAAPAASGGQNG